MNYRYPAILAIFIVLTAMAVAGCTTTTTSPAVSTQPSVSKAPAASTPAASTPAATPAASGPNLNFDAVKMMEYKMTSVTDGQTTSMNMRIEYEATQVHMKITSEGMTIMDTTVPRDQVESTQGTGTLGEAMDPDFSTSLTTVGIEAVTVPKGTFTCTKYTVTDGNVISSYWVANNVPLPIKMTQTDDGKETMSMELVDYQV